MNKDTVTEANMRRLSMVCDEIDRFEREFVDPVRLSASSLSLATSYNAVTKTSRTKLKKHHSTNICPAPSQLEKMNKKYFSTDSVTSGYDSGAFSRESTPDLSLSSSLTESCGNPVALPSHEVDSENNIGPEQEEGFLQLDNESIASSVHLSSRIQNQMLSSTPRKPHRSQSERIVPMMAKVPAIRRSHTTHFSDSDSFILSKRFPQTISRAACSADCKAKVTVNGFCYH